MGKLLDRLEEQLKTKYKKDAEDCLKIYKYLLETTNSVWQSDWSCLVTVIFEGFPSDKRRFKPTKIGYVFLKGLEEKEEQSKHEIDPEKVIKVEPLLIREGSNKKITNNHLIETQGIIAKIIQRVKNFYK